MKTYKDKRNNYVVKDINFTDLCNLDNNLLHIIIELITAFRKRCIKIPCYWDEKKGNYNEKIIKPIEYAFREVVEMRNDADADEEAIQKKLEKAFRLLSKEFFALWV